MAEGKEVIGEWRLVSDNGMFALFDDIGIPLPRKLSVTFAPVEGQDGAWSQVITSKTRGDAYIFKWGEVQEKVIYEKKMKVQHILKDNTILEIREGIDADGNSLWKLEAERIFTGNKMISNYKLGNKVGSSEFEKVE